MIDHVRAYVSSRIGVGETDDQIGSGNTLINSLSADAVGVFNGTIAGTLVANDTVGICAYAWHTGLPVGWSIILGGNSYVANGRVRVPGSDLGFARLNAKVTGVNPMPVLPVPSGSKYGGAMTGLPAIWFVHRTGRIQLREVSNLEFISDSTGESISLTNENSDPDWNIGSFLVPGDSSSPMLTIINEQLVLLSLAYSGGQGSAIHAYHDEAVALWASNLGVTDAYTEADLSGFDNYEPEEPPEEEPLEEPLSMAKTTTFGGGNMDTAGDWDNGLPVAGDTAILDATVEVGTMPSGVTVILTAGNEIAGGTFNSPVDVTAGACTLTDGVFNKGIVFTSSTTYGVNNRSTNVIVMGG